MSREIRRVPVDFDYPLNKRWWGYLCRPCEVDIEHEPCEVHEPPTGDGWQAWETVSEGSPISPVFATADELVEWAAGPDGQLGVGGTPVSRTAARRFIADGWAPSMVYTPETGLLGGVEYAATREVAP